MREIKLFEFKELLVVAQRNALDDFRDNHPEEVFNESDADMMQDWLEEYVETEYKLKRVDISFNLSYSQGDGVAFTKDYDQEELMVLAKKFLSDEDYDKLIEYIEVTDIWGQIEIVGRHSHENSMRFTIENSNLLGEDDESKLEYILYELEKDISGMNIDIAIELKNMGYDYIEECGWDDAVEDKLICYGYEFYEDGTIYTK